MMQISGHGPYRAFAQGFKAMAQNGDLMAAGPKVIADLISHVTTVGRPKARYVAPFHG